MATRGALVPGAGVRGRKDPSSTHPSATASPTSFLAELEDAVRTLQRVVRSASPRSFSGDQARAAVALFAESERAASSGIALFTPVLAQSGS